MICFPFMKEIGGALCLLVGGGEVALRKAKALRPFGVKLRVCARELAAGWDAPAFAAEYSPALLEGADLCVAATDDPALNARVAADCRARGIPVNCVDDRANCDFYFPALIAAGDVSIGISTGGAAPALAAALRRRIERALPKDLGEIAARAEQLRGDPAAYAAYIEEALGPEK